MPLWWPFYSSKLFFLACRVLEKGQSTFLLGGNAISCYFQRDWGPSSVPLKTNARRSFVEGHERKGAVLPNSRQI